MCSFKEKYETRSYIDVELPINWLPIKKSRPIFERGQLNKQINYEPILTKSCLQSPQRSESREFIMYLTDIRNSDEWDIQLDQFQHDNPVMPMLDISSIAMSPTLQPLIIRSELKTTMMNNPPTEIKQGLYNLDQYLDEFDTNCIPKIIKSKLGISFIVQLQVQQSTQIIPKQGVKLYFCLQSKYYELSCQSTHQQRIIVPFTLNVIKTKALLTNFGCQPVLVGCCVN